MLTTESLVFAQDVWFPVESHWHLLAERQALVCHLVAVGFVAVLLADTEQGRCRRLAQQRKTRSLCSKGLVYLEHV